MLLLSFLYCEMVEYLFFIQENKHNLMKNTHSPMQLVVTNILYGH